MTRTRYEEALLADIYAGTYCPHCGVVWDCGETVREREAFCRDGGLVCSPCFAPPAAIVAAWMLRHVDELRGADAELAQRVQGLEDDEIDESDLNRAWALMMEEP